MELTLFNPNNISKFNDQSETNEYTKPEPLFSISYTCFKYMYI